jgi:anti-sigma-K factor RskA
MKTEKVDRLENFAAREFRSEKNFIVPENWQSRVISEIKNFERKVYSKPQEFIQTRLVWRFAVASVAVAALICVTLYLAAPDYSGNDVANVELAFDNYDNYIETIAQL